MFKKLFHNNKKKNEQKNTKEIKKQIKKQHQNKATKKFNKNRKAHFIRKEQILGRRKMVKDGHNYDLLLMPSIANSKLVKVDTLSQQRHYQAIVKKQKDAKFLFDVSYNIGSLYDAINNFDFDAFNHFLNMIVVYAHMSNDLISLRQRLTKFSYSAVKILPKRYLHCLQLANAKMLYIAYIRFSKDALDSKDNADMTELLQEFMQNNAFIKMLIWTKKINDECKKALFFNKNMTKAIQDVINYLKNHKAVVIKRMTKIAKNNLSIYQANEKARQRIIHYEKQIDNGIATNKEDLVSKGLNKLPRIVIKHPDWRNGIIIDIKHIYNSFKPSNISYRISSIVSNFFINYYLTALKQVQKSHDFKIMNQSLIQWLQKPNYNTFVHHIYSKVISNKTDFPPTSQKEAFQILTKMVTYLTRHQKEINQWFTKALISENKDFRQKSFWSVKTD